MSLKSVVRNVAAAGVIFFGSVAPSYANDEVHLIRDAEIEAYLRDFTDPILEAADLHPEDVDIYLLSDPTINAFVANGQNIHLNVGLIMEADTPNELIGVIAHETGHIAAAHGARRVEGMKAANRTALATIGLGILAIAAGAGEAGAAIIASSSQFAYKEFASYTRPQEAQADQAALTYLEKTGRSPVGLIDFFGVFRSDQLYAGAERYEFYLTHPLASDRVESLRNRAEATGLMGVPDSQSDIDKLARIKAKLKGYIEAPARVKAAYPPTDQSVYAKYARAVNALQNGLMASAISQSEDLVALEPENPYFHELLAQIYFEKGEFDKSIEWNRKSIEYDPDSALLKMNLATALLNRAAPEDLTEAGDLLEWVTIRERENPGAWYYLSLVRSKQGRIGEADLAIAEQASSYGDCQRAAIFSRRAQDGLEKNSPAYLRASDITKMCAVALFASRQR